MVLTRHSQSEFASFIQEYLDWHVSRATQRSLLSAFISMLDPQGSNRSLSYRWGAIGAPYDRGNCILGGL